MSDYMCPYRCSYRTNAGYCGYTGGHEACQYRRINGFDYESKQFYAEPVKTPEERYVWPPKTNADRIRAMTDEELSIALCRCGCPPYFWNEDGTLDCPKPDSDVCEEVCGECWLDWLKQEVTENDS